MTRKRTDLQTQLGRTRCPSALERRPVYFAAAARPAAVRCVLAGEGDRARALLRAAVEPAGTQADPRVGEGRQEQAGRHHQALPQRQKQYGPNRRLSAKERGHKL